MGYTNLILNDLPPWNLGSVVGTTAVVDLDVDIFPYLVRHKNADFGDQTNEEKSHNYSAMLSGNPVRSKYDLVTPDGRAASIYIETNAKRTKTAVCLVEEYDIL